jgi:predicted heme/steroid binding protein
MFEKRHKRRGVVFVDCFHVFWSMDLPVYTKQQLALRNGQDKPQIWVAYKGLIYDVTDSRLWRNGKHYEHWAGQDLTDELPDAPHTEAVFEKFNVIGAVR